MFIIILYLSTHYTDWIERTASHLLAEETSPTLPTELELQSLWYQGAFGLNFTTTDGKAVHIRYLGEWNHSAGPDFLECLIKIDGEERKGAIELDLSAAHWESHGHSVNTHFNSVILHVSFSPTVNTTFCRTTDHQVIPQVLLTTEQIKAAVTQPHTQGVDAIPGYCAENFAAWSEY